MSDEGFHEIQLNGKQLVFLFMAATVVSVVIFLCGVMVGRGVPDRAAVASNEPAGSTPETRVRRVDARTCSSRAGWHQGRRSGSAADAAGTVASAAAVGLSAA